MARAGRCLVTGASGFIGSALVRRLEGLYGEVWRLVRPGDAGAGAPRTLAADLAAGVPALAQLAPLEAIFHLAGRAHKADRRRTEEADHYR
ncbi:MAG: NAD-dependent epimerase/dehydratase family protein, partial [Thermoanaerobaculia bacterium]